MLQSTNLTGRIVAVRPDKKSPMLLAAKVIKSYKDGYDIEYAAGNVEFMDLRQVSIAPPWIIADMIFFLNHPTPSGGFFIPPPAPAVSTAASRKP